MQVVPLALQLSTAVGLLLLGLGQLPWFAGVGTALGWRFVSRVGRASFGAGALFAGVMMCASLSKPFLAFFAAALAALLFVVAVASFALRGARRAIGVASGMLVAVVAVGVLQPLGLRVLSLPKAEPLPYEPVAAARVLGTYAAGTWFESVRVARDGTIFMTANRGENWQTGDKSHVVAQVLARSPKGDERVFFDLPAATTAGVLAFDRDGALFLTSDGAARGVWRLGPDGKGVLIASLPEGSWPNGICAGPDGNLYVADALRGAVWRIDPQSGASEIAREDASMKARRFVALAPAANGIHFAGRDLFVTVSDAATVLKLHLGDDGQLGAPSVHATGVPGDDFAIDTAGTLYVTTHPYDTLVRVTADGRRAVVADARQGVVGAVDAAFGVLPGDTNTLYVVTDGGAFSSGDPRAAGTLVALTLHADR